MTNVVPFNPLDKANLGASVADALLTGAIDHLGNLGRFNGAGVYAIYYGGPFAAYADLVKHNQAGKAIAPIYVGKAVPSGARKGRAADATASRALFDRLQEHAMSIAATSNLDIGDFSCRYLVVDDIWIPLGESLLIARFSPVWNQLLDGFGNHDPGAGRHKGLIPRWDVLHPGRTWAGRLQPRAETAADIEQEVRQYLGNNPFLSSLP